MHHTLSNIMRWITWISNYFDSSTYSNNFYFQWWLKGNYIWTYVEYVSWRQILTSYVFTCRNRNYVCLWNIFSFSNFLLIACDSVILDSLKHVFYIVLHMNLTLSLFLSLYLTHSFFRFSLFLFLSVSNPPRSLPYLPFWTITTWPSIWDWEILLK